MSEFISLNDFPIPSIWKSADGTKGFTYVFAKDTKRGTVRYIQKDGSNNEKDYWCFQCRYCLHCDLTNN